MRVYVAGKYEEKARVQEVQDQLIKAGHTITFDWTRSDEGFTRNQAGLDFYGVLACEAFVFVAEKDLRYAGAFTELGIALCQGAEVYLLGPHADRCIFTLLPQVHRGLEGLLERR